MIAEIRSKAVTYARQVFNRKVLKEFVQEFLPEDRNLELKLQEICSNCPLHDAAGNHENLSPSARESVDGCRRRYFGILLQSFLGSPGDQETEWLYSYLRSCERCLLSATDSHRHPRGVVIGREEISAARGLRTSNS